IFLSPEKALSSEFHEKVLKNFVFKDSCIAVVIDEAHCIIEWGPDFREHYDDLGKLRARLPSSIPVLVASATMPNEVRLSIQYKLGLGRDCAHVAVSNAKPNVALSVRIMQHPQNTYADLMFLFLPDLRDATNFPQTLIYTNERQVAEEIQDFLRDHCPPTTGIPPDKFEFYHRSIDEGRKKIVQDGIRSGFYRCVSATDALGMGMDFRGIKRVILWTEPRSFLSFVQKAGRCTRDFTELGEVILFITKKSYARHLVESELNEELDDGANDGDEMSAPDDEHDFPAMDRIAAIDIEEEQDEEVIGSPQIEIQQSRRGRKKAATSAIEAKDRRFFSCFIATNQCRRIPWNEFFGNESKSEQIYVFIFLCNLFFLVSLFPAPLGARCCDNCNPDLFPAEFITVKSIHPTCAGRGLGAPTEQLKNAIEKALRSWRSHIISQDYPNQQIITGRQILADDVIERIAS
ncbi:P-loop containing nucleoside triphosphate hydrolase protein, partial [Dendrothele bispora CBS 962.96]